MTGLVANTLGIEPKPHLSVSDRLFDFHEPDVELTTKPEVIADKKASFLAPNEEYPADAVRILDQAVSGVYLSVGTERGFIGAALASNITHLLLADRDPRVVFFNRINIALLTVAQSREEY